MATETYRSIHTGAEIDAAVTFAKNPDSAPAIGSQVAVTSDGVAVALRNAASDTDEAITAEAAARQAADTTLQNNINAEAATRQTQINSVSDLIGHVSDRLNAETAAREQADTALGTEVATKQDILTFDNVPVQNSSNPVKSGGIWTKLKELNSAMQGGDADILAEMRNNYARVDGAYETLTSGNADQLLATQYVEDSVPYIFRPSGNHADIGDREFDTVVGGSIVWNQLMPPENADTVGVDANVFGRITGEDNICTVGHKYFVSVDVTSLSNLADCRLRHPASQDLSLYTGKNQFIVDATSTDFEIVMQSLELGTYVEVSLPANFAMICDLTLMLGPAVADYIYNLEAANTGAGVAYLLNLIPLLGGDYMAQNAGTMLSVNASAHETVGFNQWDESKRVEGKGIAAANGAEFTDTSWDCTDYIPVIAGQDYYLKITKVASSSFGYAWYDVDKNVISSTNYPSPSDADVGVVTAPANASYLRASIKKDKNPVGSVNINLSWNNTRNGEYEPYEKRTYLLTEGELYPATTLRGVPVVENSKVRYDGDIYNADGTVERRYAEIDLGNQNWTYESTYQRMYCNPTDMSVSRVREMPIVCGKYQTISDGRDLSSVPDKTIYNGYSGTTARLYIKDTAYSDPAAFKAAMAGVTAVFKRATPTTETATPYQSPQIVDDWGTERYVDYEYSLGQRPIPVPVGHDTKYPANLRDKVQHLPSLADSDGTYAIQQVGTQMTLVPLPVVIPEPPSANGTYTLKATVSGGAATLTWEV